MDAASSTSLKRPLEVPLISATEPVTPRKRQRRTNHTSESTPESGTSRRTPNTPRKPKTPLEWQDIPKWTHNRSPFLELPVELLDKIAGCDSGLELQDHLALSGTCRTFRNAYTDAVWKALIYSYSCFSFIDVWSTDHIFSKALEASQDSENRGMGRDKEQPQLHLHQVVERVNTTRMTKTMALQTFKISEKDLAPLKFQQKRNPHARRNGAPMKLYIQAQVRSLAIRIHGGPLGHAGHMRKIAQTAEKTRITKEKNGTTPKKKDLTGENSTVGLMLAGMYDSGPDSDYGDYSGCCCI